MAKRDVSRSAPTPENPEWTRETMARAKRVEDIPALAALAKRKPGARGPQRTPTKIPVSLRLDRKVIEAFKATGAGWQGKMNEVLAAAARTIKR